MRTRDGVLSLSGVCGVIAATQGIGPWWAQILTAAAGAACLWLARPPGLGTAADAVRRAGGVGLLALMVGGCGAAQAASVSDVDARVSESGGLLDIAISGRVCVDDGSICLDVRAFYLKTEDRQIVCLELPRYTTRPVCREVE
jgi:hypothetical protein